MTVFFSILGAALVALGLYDIFQQLFRPFASGSVSRPLIRIVWRLFHLPAGYSPKMLSLAGSVALIVVISVWVSMLVVGWALIFLPHLPDQFNYAQGLDSSVRGGIVDALYLSMVILATLGFGDVTPTSDWLLILLPLEAMFGFALLTAGIAWVLSLYPAVTQKYSLAHHINLVRESTEENKITINDLDESSAAELISHFSCSLISVHINFTQFYILYYFNSREKKASLPLNISYLTQLAAEAKKSDSAAVRFQAAVLQKAVDEFAQTLGKHFLKLKSASTEEILTAFAADHMHDQTSKKQKA